MALFREVRRLSDDVVPSVFYSRDERRSLLVWHDGYTVAHSHGIGASNALQPKVSLYLTVNKLATVIGPDGVPAACILYY